MQFKGIKNDFKKRVKYTRLNLSVHYYKYATSVFPKIDSYKKKWIWKHSSCKGSMKNICLTSGLERSSTVTKFRVSRHVFKKKCGECYFPGIRKASW